MPVTTKPVVTPTQKMKPLYWKRIILAPTSRTESLWDQVLEPTINAKDFEDHFCQKKKVTTLEKSVDLDGDVAAAPEKIKLVSVVDLKKSNAIAFMLAKLPSGGVPALKTAVEKMDTSRLNKEVIKTLMNNVPTEEDFALIKSSEVPVANLDKPERWILDMQSLVKENLRERLRAWLFQLEFSDLHANIVSSVAALSTATADTRSCENLRRVLGVVLALGNHMNGGSARGQADGFSLEILDNLSTTKDIDNKQTLLEYVARVALDKYPKVIGLADELEALRGVQLSVSDMQADMAEIESGFSSAKAAMTKAMEVVSSDGEFAKTVPAFMTTAETEIKRAKDMMKDVVERFYSLQEYFGYPKSANSSLTCQQFFGSIHGFVTNLTKMVLKLEKERKANTSTSASSGEGKKIAGGADPLAALANAIKLGQQSGLRKRAPTTNTVV
eukprot:gene16880-20072_t